MSSFEGMEISYLLVLSWFREVMIFFTKSCWDGVCSLCWTDDSFTWVDTGKVCILCMVWRVHMESS